MRFLPFFHGRRWKSWGEKRSGTCDALGPAPRSAVLLRAQCSCSCVPHALPPGAGSKRREAGGTDNPRFLASHALLCRRLAGGAVLVWGPDISVKPKRFP